MRKGKSFEEVNGNIVQKRIINEANNRDRYKMSVDPLWMTPIETKLSPQVKNYLNTEVMI